MGSVYQVTQNSSAIALHRKCAELKKFNDSCANMKRSILEYKVGTRSPLIIGRQSIWG